MTSPKNKLQPCNENEQLKKEANKLLRVGKTLDTNHVLQTMRTCNLHQVYEQIMAWSFARPDLLAIMHSFYLKANRKPSK